MVVWGERVAGTENLYAMYLVNRMVAVVVMVSGEDDS